MNPIFIPGNVPSLKNSKRIVQIPIKGTGKKRPMLLPSKAHAAYERATIDCWMGSTNYFRVHAEQINGPLNVYMRFIRGSRHKFDYTNAADTIQDLMTKYGWIDDDNCDCMKPVFVDYEYDKENPGVWIWI